MSGFQHSEKVPTQYKRTAAILKTALENYTKSLKTLISEEKHAKIGSLHAVVKLYADNRVAIDAAIDETSILKDNPRLNPNLCKVLIIELIFRKHELRGESKPVQTVRAYKERLEKVLSGAAESSETQKASKPRYVRINTNLLTLAKAHKTLAREDFRFKENSFENYEDFLKAVEELADDEYMLDMHVDNLLIFNPKNKGYFAVHRYTMQKKFMLQDKGTCLVAELLRPPAGSTVLDMCAAPGMKTIHICNVLQNQGKIYAIEKSTERYSILCNMVEEAGCNIVMPVNGDALTTTAEQFPGIQYILVDPSCTGSGMQNRLSLQSDEKDPERVSKLAGLQIKMLSYAMSAFPDVKRIAYSTCSLYQEENEEVVEKCLRLNPGFKLLSGKKALRNKWRNFGSSEFKNIGKKCIYCKPKEDFTDGIFIAIFEKCSSSEDE